MAASEKALRVLVVDDNRDGADALGLLVEELGNQVHVTYGGTQALDVANAWAEGTESRERQADLNRTH
jgi:CheY-like chemotaxis protein